MSTLSVSIDTHWKLIEEAERHKADAVTTKVVLTRSPVAHLAPAPLRGGTIYRVVSIAEH